MNTSKKTFVGHSFQCGVSDIAAVQLDAGSQPPRRKRKYMAVDQRLKLLKDAYIGGENTIGRYIVGVAYTTTLVLYNVHIVVNWTVLCLCNRELCRCTLTQ